MVMAFVLNIDAEYNKQYAVGFIYFLEILFIIYNIIFLF